MWQHEMTYMFDKTAGLCIIAVCNVWLTHAQASVGNAHSIKLVKLVLIYLTL